MLGSCAYQPASLLIKENRPQKNREIEICLEAASNPFNEKELRTLLAPLYPASRPLCFLYLAR